MPEGARRDATEICTELLHGPAVTESHGELRVLVRTVVNQLKLPKVARGNAKRMNAAVGNAPDTDEKRAHCRAISGALFVQVMAALK